MSEETPFPGSEVVLDFADGAYRFRLDLPQIAELQEKCSAGVGEVFARLMRGRYLDGGEVLFLATEAKFRAEDIYETIRLGLIGGGGGTVNGQPVKVDAVKARQLLERYVHPLPYLDQWKLAAAVMAARIVGYDDGRPKKPGSAQKKSKAAEQAGSATPTP